MAISDLPVDEIDARATRSAKILVTRRLPEMIEARMRDLFDVQFNENDVQWSSAELLSRVSGKTVLVSTITDRLDQAVIEQLPDELCLIAQFGNGVDNIDIEAAHGRGIAVTNTPSVLTQDTADMALALILAVPRRLAEGAQVLAKGDVWSGWSPTGMMGRRLGGKAIGIVGMGRIGTAVARRARAFGLAINYYSRTRRPAEIEAPLDAVCWPSLDDMLAAVDIVSLHTPHTRETFNMLSSDRLKRMKQGAFLVNVSRPELIDEDALVAEIENGHLSGAGLDVFEHKRKINPRLLALAAQNRVVLTPHMGSSTLEARIEMGETVIVNIRVFLDGHKPPQRVLAELVNEPVVDLPQ